MGPHSVVLPCLTEDNDGYLLSRSGKTREQHGLEFQAIVVVVVVVVFSIFFNASPVVIFRNLLKITKHHVCTTRRLSHLEDSHSSMAETETHVTSTSNNQLYISRMYLGLYVKLSPVP